jgi:DNA-binding response OmpR family regulator
MAVSGFPNTEFGVLIVEDNRDIATSLALYLRVATGFRVEVAYDGQAGLEAAVRQRPDAVVCDITMPKLDGIALAHELRRLLPNKPLLLAVTGDAALADRLFQAGYDNYYVKPANPIEIETVIRLHEINLRSRAR